jgi:hypothetical protein
VEKELGPVGLKLDRPGSGFLGRLTQAPGFLGVATVVAADFGDD